jgi:hypothetical protein
MNNITMHDPMLTDMLADMYFAVNEEEKNIPTVPGLALAIGFNRTKDITDALKAYEEDASHYPQASMEILIRCLTRIEDNYVQNGLKSKFPAALVKFCLGTYHDRQEKEPPKQLGEFNNFTIVFEQPKQLDVVQQRQLQQPAGPVIELQNVAN